MFLVLSTLPSNTTHSQLSTMGLRPPHVYEEGNGAVTVRCESIETPLLAHVLLKLFFLLDGRSKSGGRAFSNSEWSLPCVQQALHSFSSSRNVSMSVFCPQLRVSAALWPEMTACFARSCIFADKMCEASPRSDSMHSRTRPLTAPQMFLTRPSFAILLSVGRLANFTRRCSRSD